MKRKMKSSAKVLSLQVAIVLAVLCCWSCGVKSPPVVPAPATPQQAEAREKPRSARPIPKASVLPKKEGT
jgi:hypothetical protein